VPWAYLKPDGLKEFLSARLADGYEFPLNPKWITCDKGFRELYDQMRTSPEASASLATWLPQGSGLREKLDALLVSHPGGFEPGAAPGDEEVEDVDFDAAAWQLHRHEALLRAKTKLRAVFRLNQLARSSVARAPPGADAPGD
jgi:hypothetical protein